MSVDLSSTSAIANAGLDRFRETLAGLQPALVFANEAEAELVGPVEVETLAVKLGARGCVVTRDGVQQELPAVEAAPVDTTGAGDAFAAGFLVSGPELALQAAARCISRLGATPEV